MQKNLNSNAYYLSKITLINGRTFTKYLHGTLSLLNIQMIFGIKEKWIILTHTMYCWLLLQMLQGHIYKKWSSFVQIVFPQIILSKYWISLFFLFYFFQEASAVLYCLRYRKVICMNFVLNVFLNKFIDTEEKKRVSWHCPKYYKQKTDASLPLCQVGSLFDTSDQWFQLPERLLVHWSWFESDLCKPEGEEDFILHCYHYIPHALF